jgi:uncharacterized iron-regulated membrane protein
MKATVMKAWVLKFHRWLALVFALPLLVVIVTGLVLSFEPWLVTGTIDPGSLSAERIQALLRQHDPRGQARALSYRAYDNTLTRGSGRGGGVLVDVITGQKQTAPSPMATLMGMTRRMHETLLRDAGWLVIVSTAAMLVLAVLGVLMGLPRIKNTVPGWHKGMAWGLLPLIVLSPLTGLLIAAGIAFTTPPPAALLKAGTPLTLAEAVGVVGGSHDLSSLVWLRPQGGRLLVRLVENGEYTVYAVMREGTIRMPRNWPRLWHEGNFAGAWSAAMNVIVSIALLGLLATGVWVWTRRRLRRRVPVRSLPA